MDTSVSLVLVKRQQNCSIKGERVKGTGGGEDGMGWVERQVNRRKMRTGEWLLGYFMKGSFSVAY